MLTNAPTRYIENVAYAKKLTLTIQFQGHQPLPSEVIDLLRAIHFELKSSISMA